MDFKTDWSVLSCSQLAEIIKSNADRVLIIDSRSFLEYNTSHILHSVNVCCSKLVKRRLQQDKVDVCDLLSQTCEVSTVRGQDIVVYDQCSTTTTGLSPDCFLLVLLNKLVSNFKSVYILRGGFLEFQTSHPSLCESKTTTTTSSGGYKCPPLTSMSQPCLPVSNVGPIKILPFLYLGSQTDALSQDTMQQNGITYVLNVSTSCPRPPFITENHFLRLAVNDNYSDKLVPLFPEAFQFLDKVRESNENVLIHCLAGISRSATVAIAYIMYHLNMSSDEAYKYVKDKRPTISPNFNFLGQLLEYEKQLKQKKGEQENVSPPLSVSVKKKHCAEGATSPVTPKVFSMGVGKPGRFSLKPFVFSSSSHHHGTYTPGAVQSPTTALSKLSFSAPSPVTEEFELTTPIMDKPPPLPGSSASDKVAFPQFPTTSLDLLSFTPCLASESRGPAGGESSASSARLGGGSYSVTQTESKSPSTGTKRPLSSTLSLELDTSSLNYNSKKSQEYSCQDGSGHCGPSSSLAIKLRSPELKVKRPLVRPNSIAFSSYPVFDKQEQQPVIESSQQSHVMDYTTTVTNITTTNNSAVVVAQTLSSDHDNNTSTWLNSSAVSNTNSNNRYVGGGGGSSVKECIVSISNTHNQRPATFNLSSTTVASFEKQEELMTLPSQAPMMVSSQSSYVVEMRTKETAQQGRSRTLEQARKSRSLEDILNADGEENLALGGCPSHVRARRQKRLINAASQGSSGMESVHRCRGVSGGVSVDSHHHHQSNSSISSGGSHSSLHGSLEVIQVS